MAAVILFIVAILGVILIAGIIIFFMRLYHEPEEFQDYTIVENYMPQITNGYSLGVLIEIIKGTERDGIVFTPIDVDYLRKVKKGEKLEIKNEIIFVPKNKIVFLPRGNLSGQRNLLKILPPNPEDLPDGFRETPLGIAMMEIITNINAKDHVIKVQRKEKELEDEMLLRTKGKDRVREYLELDKSLNKDIARKVIDTKDDRKTNVFSPQPSYNQGG